MKNLYTKILLINIFLFAVVSCGAQQVLPLNAGWYKSPNGSYFKDLNNELDQFVGTWKANYNDKIITLYIIKEIQKPFEDMEKSFYKDQLNIRYQIVNNNGMILHSTLNNNFTLNPDFGFVSLFTKPSTNEVILIYNGGNCSIGLGTVYFKKISAAQFQWNYKPQGEAISSTECPAPIDWNIYLPTTENLIFTKQ